MRESGVYFETNYPRALPQVLSTERVLQPLLRKVLPQEAKLKSVPASVRLAGQVCKVKRSSGSIAKVPFLLILATLFGCGKREEISVPQETRTKLDFYISTASLGGDEAWKEVEAEFVKAVLSLAGGFPYINSLVTNWTTGTAVRERLLTTLLRSVEDGAIPEERVLEPVIKVLRNRAEMDAFRLSIAKLLLKRDTPLRREIIINLLADKNESPDLRMRLIKLLPDEYKKDVAETLKSLLSDSSAKLELRWCSAFELSGRDLLRTAALVRRLLGQEAFDFLVQAFSLLPEEVQGREQFARAIAETATDGQAKALLKRTQARVELRIAMAGVLERRAPDVVLPILREILSSRDAPLRLRAHSAQLLASRQPEKVGKELAHILTDPKEENRIRWLAAETIGKLKLSLAIPSLLEALGDDDPSISHTSARALMGFPRNELCSSILEALLKERNGRSLTKLAEISGRMKLREAIPFLVKLLDDPRREVRVASLRALAEIGELAVAPILRKLPPQKEIFLAKEVEFALSSLSSAETKDDLSTLWCKTKSGEKIPPPRLEEALNSEDWLERLVAYEALAFSGQLPGGVLRDERDEIRVVGCILLGNEKGCKPALKLLNSGDAFVRRSACVAIGKCGRKVAEKLASSKLKAIITEREQSSSLRELLQLTRSDDPIVRAKAQNALREIWQKVGVARLKPVLKDPDPWLVLEASSALYTLGVDSSVPYLLEGLQSEDRDIARFSELRLTSLTQLGYGFDLEQWKQWYEKSMGSHFSLKEFLVYAVSLIGGLFVLAGLIRLGFKRQTPAEQVP